MELILAFFTSLDMYQQRTDPASLKKLPTHERNFILAGKITKGFCQKLSIQMLNEVGKVQRSWLALVNTEQSVNTMGYLHKAIY